MLYFELDTIIISMSLTVLSALITLWTRFKPVYDAGSAVKAAPSETDNGICPKASVIVDAFTTEDELYPYLEMVMNQDYPDYEVILVNEGSAETTAELTERLLKIYPQRLYVTFVPSEARNLSRRKLVETVGMKAAKGEIAITTASNCKIPSSGWLSGIMKPFMDDSSVDVVLGYSHIDIHNLKGAGKWYRQMDATLTACQWIGAAYNRHPYRGDANNLAIRRNLFFDHKGYSKTIHLMNGDDDLFLREFMHGNNTRLAISDDSILTTEWGDSGNRIMAELKERYNFTARFLPRLPFIRAGIGSFMHWLTFLLAITAIVTGLTLPGIEYPFGYVIPATALLILILFWLAEIGIYRRTSRRLGSICLWWSLPWFLLWLPFGNFIFKVKHFRHRRKNYTFT